MSAKAQYFTDGALEKRLTHMPFTHTFTGSNPVRVTILKSTGRSCDLPVFITSFYSGNKEKRVSAVLFDRAETRFSGFFDQFIFVHLQLLQRRNRPYIVSHCAASS